MIKNERLDQIIELLQKEKYCSVAYLAQTLYVAPVTIRRDLKKLEQDGIVNTCYGGASIITNTNRDVPLDIRENFNNNIKFNLAKEAAKLITNGSTVFLDASSTASLVANFLTPEQHVTVITNGMRALTLLSQRHIRAYSTGGRLVDNSLAFTGSIAVKTISSMRADFMFFSSQGLTLDGNITDFSESETELRQAMLSRSAKRYFICDSSKIGKTFLFQVCNVNDLDDVFCDKPINFIKPAASEVFPLR